MENSRFIVPNSGGLFKTGDLILPQFSRGVEKVGGRLSAPKFEPVHGALLLAFEQYNASGLSGLKKRIYAKYSGV